MSKIPWINKYVENYGKPPKGEKVMEPGEELNGLIELHVFGGRPEYMLIQEFLPFTTSTDERLGHAIIREMMLKGFSYWCEGCSNSGHGITFRRNEQYAYGTGRSEQFNIAIATAALEALGVSDGKP